MKKWIIGGIIILFMGTSAFASFGKTKKESIKIGAALAMTGDAAPWGETSLRAAQLAVDLLNAKGGIHGKKIELIVEDIRSSSKNSVTAVSKLFQIDKVDAVIITWLDSYQGSQNSVPKNKLLISQDAAIEAVNTPINHSNVFSLWYRTKSKSEATIDEMVRSGKKTLYLVTQKDSYYEKLVEFLKNEAEQKEIKIIGEDSLSPESDSRTVILKTIAAKPDVVFFGSYDNKISVGFLKSYHELGNKIPLQSDEFIEQDFKSKTYNKEWLEGISYYVPSASDSSFRNEYVKRYKEEPEYSAQTTYDTINVIAKYLEEKPKNKDSDNYMRNTTFPTLTYGPITFDDIGGIVTKNRAISMKKIIGGEIISLDKK